MDQPMRRGAKTRSHILLALLGIGSLSFSIQASLAADDRPPSNNINIFAPSSTPAIEIRHIAFFVFSITGAVFIVVAALLSFVILRFRARKNDDSSEPPQVYGSNQIELAWTVLPVLVVVVLFLATARI